MASSPRGRRPTEERSGGKIVRNRRTAAYRTPYDRPVLPTPRVQPPSPNWLTGIVVPTSRMIANGATKILSSIFRADSSSSSSSSSSGSDSEMEDEVGDGKNHYHDSIDALVEDDGTTSKLTGCYQTESQLTVGKSEAKILIEKLLMQETFSRDEGDRLKEIISSRVIDGSPTKEGQEGRLDIHDRCTKAVQEAKQWLEEKKVSSNTKLNLDRRDYPFNSTVPSQVTRGESGSPVDMAKSYMKARPPWASASVNYDDIRTPSPMRRRLSNGETSHSIPDSSFSTSKKIHSLGSGSWNIQEEIRKVRSKATENMLKTVPSTKADFSAFVPERKSSRKSLLADELSDGEKGRSLNLLAAPNNIAAGNSSSHALPASGVELTRDDPHREDIISAPVLNSSAQNQDLEAAQTAEEEDHAASGQPTTLDLPSEHETGKRLSEGTCVTCKEGTELRPEPDTNGFPLSGSSLIAGTTEPSLRAVDDKNQNSTTTSHDKLAASAARPEEETWELSSEFQVEIPAQDETDIAASGEEPSSVQEPAVLALGTVASSEPVLTDKAAAAANEGERRKGRKVSSRYNKKTAVRGGR